MEPPVSKTTLTDANLTAPVEEHRQIKAQPVYLVHGSSSQLLDMFEAYKNRALRWRGTFQEFM